MKIFTVTLALVALELVLTWCCREHVGPITASAEAVMFVIFPALFSLAVTWRWPRVGRVLFLGAALPFLAWKSWQYTAARLTQAEAESLVQALHDMQKRSGSLPATIGGHLEGRGHLRRRLSDYSVDGESFRLAYHLATPAIEYWYDSRTGWGHSDD